MGKKHKSKKDISVKKQSISIKYSPRIRITVDCNNNNTGDVNKEKGNEATRQQA